MGAGVDFLQCLDGNVRVTLGRLQAGVAKHGLDVTNVRPVLQHEGCEGVAEEMATAGLAHPGGRAVPGNQSREVFDGKRTAALREEEDSRVRACSLQQLRPGLGEIRLIGIATGGRPSALNGSQNSGRRSGGCEVKACRIG